MVNCFQLNTATEGNYTMHVNPYCDFGTVIAGDRLIGRQREVTAISNRLLGPGGFGSLALIGMQRVGKTSLVQKAIFDQKKSLVDRRILPVYLSLGEYREPEQLFDDLISQCVMEIKDTQLATRSLLDIAETLPNAAPNQRFVNIKKFFQTAKVENLRFICVLDEFDSARYLFRGQRQCYHWLRELASNPRFKIGLLTISKRGLSRIASQSSGEDASYWHNVFMDYYVSVFSGDDLEEYYKRLKDLGVTSDGIIREQIEYHCGRHPFYLDVFAFFLVEEFISGKGHIDIEAVVEVSSTRLREEFANVCKILSEDERLPKLLQILFGPVIDVTPADVSSFLRLSLLEKKPDGTYTVSPRYLYDYLQLLSREMELWPLWSEAEQAIRRVLTAELIDKYGDEWPTRLVSAHSNLKEVLTNCITLQDDERRRFGERASDRLLDYTYPMDLFAIISSEWKLLSGILGKDKSYWNQRFTLLARVRNPLAHNRDTALADHERDTAEAYCKEILYILRTKRAGGAH